MGDMALRSLHNKDWRILLMLALVLLAPSPVLAKVGIMKPGLARGLIGANGSQPVSLSTAQLSNALRSIRYVNESLLDSGNPSPVFSEKQIHTLAPQIQHTLAGIRPGQALAFHEGKVRGEIFFSNGSLYWHLSSIENSPAFDLTGLAEEDVRTSHAVEATPEENIDVSYWRLVPQQGQALYRDRPDLLAMPVSSLKTDTTNAAPLPEVKQPEPPVHKQSYPVVAAGENRPDAATRIDTLQRLLGKTLITRDEYTGKLESIISGYEKQHPSPEAGLEFLRMLDRKGQIAPGLLQKQRKILLDRL